MREYYPKKAEIPKDIYEQVKGILKGYDRLKEDRYKLLYETPQKQEGGHSSDVGDPTAQKAIRLAYINERLHAIDQAQMWMRGKLDGRVDYDFNPLRAFYDYAYYNLSFKRADDEDNGPAERTWKRYRIRFAAIVAKNLNIF